MAEAVRPARRARAKSGRSKAKEKKKTCSEEPRKQDLDDVFIPAPARHEEVSSHGSAAQVEHAEEFTEIRLSDDAEDGQNVNHVFDVPLASLTLAKEGSQTAKPGSPTHRKEFEAIPLHEECRRDPEENAGSKLDKPQSFRGIAANESTDCVLSASTFQSSATGTQILVGIIQDGRTEKARGVKKPAAHPSEELPAAVSQPCKEAKECVQHSKLKTLYPDLSVELSHEKPTIIAVKPLLRSERLYPEILTEPELVPFTKEQLKIFEPFSWLENVDSYVEEFESVAHQERHEFHELLLNYLRCRKQLLLAEAGLQAMTSDCQSAKSRLWTFKEEQQSVQVLCLKLLLNTARLLS